jgi:hypothetical protein
MTCEVDTAAAGNFKAATIATNVPGTNGRSNAANEDFVRFQPLIKAQTEKGTDD